ADVALVDRHGRAFGAELARQLVGGAAVGAVARGHVDALPRERGGDRGADAARAAGDDRDALLGAVVGRCGHEFASLSWVGRGLRLSRRTPWRCHRWWWAPSSPCRARGPPAPLQAR